jgi:hypothetical protein
MHLPLDVLDIGSEIRRVSHLVLEADSSYPVVDVVCWLIFVVVLHENVVVERSRLNCKHEISTSFHVGITSSHSPHLDGITGKSVFAGTFEI